MVISIYKKGTSTVHPQIKVYRCSYFKISLNLLLFLWNKVLFVDIYILENVISLEETSFYYL